MANLIRDIDGVRRLIAGAVVSKDRREFATLATVDGGGVARARTVALRGFDDGADTVWFSTHVHSEKVRDLRKNPEAEVVIWVARRKIQLRLLAEWKVIDFGVAERMVHLRELREEAWKGHAGAARQMFFWPEPGEVISNRRRRLAVPRLWAESEEIPHAFAILLGTIERVDALRIVKPVHQRYVHEKTWNSWRTVRVTA